VTPLLDQAAARQPAPSGASAAGPTVPLSAGPVATAARFSARQVRDPEKLALQADQLRHHAAAPVDEDARAYQAMLDTRQDCGTGSGIRQPAGPLADRPAAEADAAPGGRGEPVP